MRSTLGRRSDLAFPNRQTKVSGRNFSVRMGPGLSDGRDRTSLPSLDEMKEIVSDEAWLKSTGTDASGTGFTETERVPIVERIVTSAWFEEAMLLVIVLNCITMGLEAENLLGHVKVLEPSVKVSEHVFTVVFSAEIIMRGMAFGFMTFLPYGENGSIGNFIDAMLVLITGLVAVWILPIFGVQGNTSFRLISTLRAMRMFRLVRLVKGSLAFKDVWLLLQGLISSYRTLVWTVAVIFFITYMFAVFGVVLIATDLKDQQKKKPEYADDEVLSQLIDYADGIGTFMLLLIQVLTLDSWSLPILRPMMRYIGWVWVFFLAYISVAVLVLMNLVTAVIVENALDVSKKNEEMEYQELERQVKRAKTKLRQLFQKIDNSGDGALTYEEFSASFRNPDIGPKLKLLGCRDEEVLQMFELIHMSSSDEDLGGEPPTITIDEFLTNFSRIQGVAQSIDTFRISKQLEKMSREMASLQKQMVQVTKTYVMPSFQPGGTMDRIASESSDQSQMLHADVWQADPDVPNMLPRTNGASRSSSKPVEEFLRSIESAQLKTDLKLQQLEGLCREGVNYNSKIVQRLEEISARINFSDAKPAGTLLSAQTPESKGSIRPQQRLACIPKNLDAADQASRVLPCCLSWNAPQ